ncbi:sialidase-like isoform X2 [Melanaphis sacchari]|uniref:sialidase-like isoform X2 n=1 Tax=Melanaphis sacchari TaxID=742174 RepID=UPI000DC142A7|nr:sialidase-like isoform X2 [Melanaphis sacchari]
MSVDPKTVVPENVPAQSLHDDSTTCPMETPNDAACPTQLPDDDDVIYCPPLPDDETPSIASDVTFEIIHGYDGDRDRDTESLSSFEGDGMATIKQEKISPTPEKRHLITEPDFPAKKVKSTIPNMEVDADRKPTTPDNDDADRKPTTTDNDDADRKPTTPDNEDADRKPTTPDNDDADRKPTTSDNDDADRKPTTSDNDDADCKPSTSDDKNDKAVAADQNDSDDEDVSIKEEIVDLGNEPYFYEEQVEERFLIPQRPGVFGFDRGLEPDHIVGATEKDGKLMFLIAWKNSVDGEADLLESTEIYNRCPQIAIKFFEDRLIYIPPEKK